MAEKYRRNRDQILYFLKDSKVPSTNNPAEVAQRPTKIKQKTKKFRSRSGAEYYIVTRSYISTYKKNDINILKALLSAFANNTVLI